ncbi:MAG: hypothetical protein ACI9WU_003684, partial [Myxococcota bacterium]
MHGRLRQVLGVVLVSVVLAGCPEDVVPPAQLASIPQPAEDTKEQPDTYVAPDIGAPDFGAPEVAVPDAGNPDIAAPDVPETDVQDIESPDIESPDVAAETRVPEDATVDSGDTGDSGDTDTGDSGDTDTGDTG